jgi:Fe2+ or Zn2+ uptake regulation protein
MSFLGFKFWPVSKGSEIKDATQLPKVHLRLSCISCGQMEEFVAAMNNELAKEVQTGTGFTAEGVTVTAAGTCRACSHRNN